MANRAPRTMSAQAQRFVRWALAGLGLVFVLYAVSDHPLYGGEPGFGWTQRVVCGLGVVLVVVARVAAATLVARLVVLCLMGTVALGLGECAGEMVLGPRHRPIYQADDEVIFGFIPGRHSVTTLSERNGGATIHHQINDDGFRGPALREAGEATRVVVYGDSFVHGYYSPDEETFVAQLGERLRGHLGREVEMVNAGVSSYGPDQALYKMQRELPALRPDAVVMTVYAGNDYGDLMRNKMFRVNPAGEVVENSWRLDEEVKMRLALAQRSSILKRAIGPMIRRIGRDRGRPNQAVDLEFLLAEAEREYQSHAVDGDPTVTNTHVDYYAADVSLTPNSDSARYKVSLMHGVLRRIAAYVGEQGLPLVFVFVPHAGDLSSAYDWPAVDPERFPDYNRRNQVRPLEELAQAEGWLAVSLFDAFQARDVNALYLHGGDDHWNGAGQAYAAELVAEAMLAQSVFSTL
ncbi:MAG: hypothetical protein B7733_25580 [Myxococcales bacterium FL481]|nr:MAG: hypothetical protein B7733_25580 [Myxococcales bacterium FL481]